MRRVSLWKGLIALGVGGGVLALVLWGVVRQGKPATGARPESALSLPRSSLKAGPLFAEQASFAFAVFLPPQATAPTPAKLAELIAQRFQPLRLAGEGLPAATPPTVKATEHTTREYPLPEGELLELAARHLSSQEHAALAASERVLLLQFTTVPPALEAMRQAHELALELAVSTGGLLWDEESGEFFSAVTWQEFRMGKWEGGVPRASRHFNARLYAEGDGTARFVTVGMGKFGLPDLEVRHVPETLTAKMGIFINVVAQLMLEGGALREDGAFPVSLSALKPSTMRERLLEQVQVGAQAGIQVGFAPKDPSQADRENQLLEIIFPARPGDSPSERPYAAITALFGGKDEIVTTSHDAVVMEASRRAREHLLVHIKPLFLEGLKPGTRLFVKAPFETASGGNEWMWVLVTGWESPSIHGLLDSKPDDVPTLKAGARVTVREESIFDYLVVLPDGSIEGNETERLLIQRARKQ